MKKQSQSNIHFKQFQTNGKRYLFSTIWATNGPINLIALVKALAFTEIVPCYVTKYHLICKLRKMRLNLFSTQLLSSVAAFTESKMRRLRLKRGSGESFLIDVASQQETSYTTEYRVKELRKWHCLLPCRPSHWDKGSRLSVSCHIDSLYWKKRVLQLSIKLLDTIGFEVGNEQLSKCSL